MSPVRGIPTSRAYWELKAEQVLNRVFEPEPPLVVEVCDTPTASPGPTPIQAAARIPVELHDLPPAPKPSSRSGHKLLIAGASIVVTLVAGLTLMVLGVWNQSQQAIRQERNMLLIERLRSMGPGTTANSADPAQTTATPEARPDGTLPPPPPGEPWMEELTSLPAGSAPPADVLKVPVNSRISNPAPAASSPGEASGGGISGSGGSMPQLVGVVQVPGQSGSAIFQIGGSSTSAAVGETIGNSGWRLRSASGDNAVIEKGGEQRRVSISSGY